MSEVFKSDYVIVRGVNVPKADIERMEQDFGATLVGDHEVIVIAALDMALKRFRDTHGRDPERVNLREDPFHWYKHAPINLAVMAGLTVPVTHKPAWFRWPRLFHGGGIE